MNTHASAKNNFIVSQGLLGPVFDVSDANAPQSGLVVSRYSQYFSLKPDAAFQEPVCESLHIRLHPIPSEPAARLFRVRRQVHRQVRESVFSVNTREEYDICQMLSSNDFLQLTC